MIQRRHRRHRQNAPQKNTGVRLAKLAVWIVAIVIIINLGERFLNVFGVGNTVRKAAAMLTVEERGVINVSVDGGPLKRAETGLKLYPGDKIVSSPNNFAVIDFFDATSVRIDERSQITLQHSEHGKKRSTLSIALEEGNLWLASPKLSEFSGSIIREVVTPYLRASIPSKTEMIMTSTSVSVFSADGIGLEISVAGNDQTLYVGEGQQFTLPLGTENIADLYAFRSPIETQQLLSDFVETSRSVYQDASEVAEETPRISPVDTVATDVSLEVDEPVDNAKVQSSTIPVRGRVGASVDLVRINGYVANINKDQGTFSQELALADEDKVRITIEAVDSNGTVVAETLRTVLRDRKPPTAPTIDTPANTGETYRTNSTELEISGTAPRDAVGIIVNDYRLQLYKPGNPRWSYLANIDFGNFYAGENIFEVIAINKGGYRSAPTTLTVILGEGQEGIISDSPDNKNVEEDDSGTKEEATRNNLPLMPGSVEIFAPTDGAPYQTSALEFLIEGNVPQEAHSVWVNGYQLRLFEQGKGFFNYIASVELNTLKRGRNVYDIVVRSQEGYVLDRVEYVVNFAVD